MGRKNFEWYKETFGNLLKSDMTLLQNQKDSLDLLLNMKKDLSFDDKQVKKYAMKVSKYTHQMADYMAGKTGSGAFNDMYYKALMFEAKNQQVDSGLLYLERYRIPKERFYEPRREVFLKHNIIQSLQDMMDDELDIFCLSVPPGCGKSTLEDFFLSLVGGWFPNDFNLSSAHSSILTRSLYDGVLEIINDPVEYAWHELFPTIKIQGTNAKETTVNLERNGRFKTWTFRSIDGSLTGATRCNRFLTADDLVSGIEEALNKSRLETLWTKVTNDLRSRRLDGCKEFYIATRWSVHDPIGKLQQLYAGNPRARFIAIPALNEDGESNFQFAVNGFSTKYFLDMKETMDEISFNCLFQQKPVEREGLLLPPDELRRFYLNKDQVPEKQNEFTIMPTRDPDAIWGVCDTKDKGTDYESLPIAYQFGEDFYIPDVVFDDNTDYATLDHKTADILIRHQPHKVRFESNQAGGRIADNIEKMIKGKCRTVIETKYTTANKETKILVNSDWIKKHCLFLEPALYKPKSDYGLFMGNVTTYTTKAKMPHDDGIDSLAMLAEYVSVPERKPAECVDSPY
nr:MAG TPA: Terminase [Caudoviricetes sp.]